MDSDLEPVFSRVTQAVSAEELFGVVDLVLPVETMLEHLAEEYKKIHDVTNPDKWTQPDDRDAAEEADAKLAKFYEKAQQRITEGIWGLGGMDKQFPQNVSFKTGTRTYYLGDVLAEGEIATLYQGFCKAGDELAGEVVIKVVNSPEDNDLAANEIRILQILHNKAAVQWKHLPFLLDSFDTDGRKGLVLRRFHGYDLSEVKENHRYRNGVDQKHMVWMLNRALSALGFVHSQGVVHGNIMPEHLMIKPEMHNMCIVDWSYAAYRPTETGDLFKVYTEIFSAPEVKAKKPPLPQADVYSLGKVMIWILGGDPKTNEMPDAVEEKLQNFLNWMVLESPLQRPGNCWDIYRELSNIIEGLWGKRKFIPFPMD